MSAYFSKLARLFSGASVALLVLPWLVPGCGLDDRRVAELPWDAGGIRQADAALLPDLRGTCTLGDAYCATATSRVSCTLEGLWSEPAPCQGSCVQGACRGVCPAGDTRCVGSTQYQLCSAGGEWSEVMACAAACFAGGCTGVCVPGARRCASANEVQICSNAGEWGPAQRCGTSCVGSSCADECEAGSSVCVSESQIQTCDENRQWAPPALCEFACSGSTCGGECIPGTRRCAPETGRPQQCTSEGLFQDGAACAGAEVCESGSCACDGERAVCGGACVSLQTDPAHCGACDRSCLGGRCAGGRCEPVVLASGLMALGPVALSDTHVYFRTGTGAATTLRRVLKQGGEVETVVPALAGLNGPAIGGNQLYFGGNGASGTAAQRQVLRANLDGSGISAFSPARELSIQRLIVPGLFVYYTVRDTALTSIFRAPLLSSGQPGAGTEALFATATGVLSSFAVVNGCLFIVDQGTPRRVLRTCSASEPPSLRHQGAGDVSFRSDQMNDSAYLYLLEAGLGTLRLPLESTAAAELVVAQNAGVPTVDTRALYHFSPAAGPGCSSAHTLFRAGKQPGSAAPVVLSPPPHACPSQVIVDADALYWSENDGSVFRLAK